MYFATVFCNERVYFREIQSRLNVILLQPATLKLFERFTYTHTTPTHTRVHHRTRGSSQTSERRKWRTANRETFKFNYQYEIDLLNARKRERGERLLYILFSRTTYTLEDNLEGNHFDARLSCIYISHRAK